MSDFDPFSTSGSDRVHLRILATTDLHAHVMPYDYHADRPDDRLGLARAAGVIATARAGAANTLLFDNGDCLQGNPLGDCVAQERGSGIGPDAPHPVIAAMNALGYDAATPGNHDLNFGLDFLRACLRDARFPVVSANLTESAGDGADSGAGRPAARTILPPFALLDRDLRDGTGRRQRLRIGVIGFLPPQTAIWDRRHLLGRAETPDIIETALAEVPRLRAAGADIVIALCHSGIGAADHTPGMENAALPLARIDGIDVVVTGHSHQVFPDPVFAGRAGVDALRGTLWGKPAVMAGFGGSHVGQIDLLLGRAAGGWQVLDHRSQARAIVPGPAQPGKGAAQPDPAAPVIAAAKSDHARTLRTVRRRVGHSPHALHSFFALVADCPAVRLVAEAQATHVTGRLRGGRWAGLPVLSAAAPFRTGGRGGPRNYTDIAPGALSLGHLSDLYPFPNTICALRLTGADIADWLERSAAIFRQIAPGSRDAPLLEAECPGYNFDTIYGLTYRIDLSQPARFDASGAVVNASARRITDLRHRGKPVDPGAVFILATNSYRGLGGGDFPGATAENVVLDGPEANRDVVLRHLATRGTGRLPARRPAWRFHPLPGTTATFETGPGARAHMAALAPLRAEDLGEDDGGFVRLRIRL